MPGVFTVEGKLHAGQGGKSPDGGCEGRSEERVSVLIPESWCYRFPHKGYFEVLTPRISECDLI